jgi:hypothetical protein
VQLPERSLEVYQIPADDRSRPAGARVGVARVSTARPRCAVLESRVFSSKRSVEEK